MEKQKRLSVKEASEILDTTPEIIRRGIKSGELPIGSAIPSVNGGKAQFLIYESKINAYLDNKREREVVDTSYAGVQEAYHKIENVYLMLKEMMQVEAR